MISLKQAKLATVILMLNLYQPSSLASDPTEATPAPSKPLVHKETALAHLAQLYPTSSSTNKNSMTDQEIDAWATKEYGRDIGLAEKLAKLDKLFEKAWGDLEQQGYDKK